MMTMGPYNSETETYQEPMPLADRALHRDRILSRVDLVARVNELRLSALTAECEAAGVDLGDYDRRILTWLSGWDPPTIQVIIGIIGRAYESGKAAGRGEK